jgi:hypothetical protein
LDLYDSFGIPIPSNDSLAALLHPAEDPLVLSVYLSPKGLVNIGILAPNLSLEWLLQLCQSSGLREEDIRAIATFQGILGVEGPTFAEVQTSAEGFGTELHYVLKA